MKKCNTIWFKIIIGITLLIVIAYATNELSKSRSFQFFGGIVTKVETAEKIVALTFDDGPGKNTDEILKILKSENVKGTFFLTGIEIENNFDAAAKIVQDGHDIGNHSYSHQRLVLKTPGFIKNEIERTDDLIRKAGYQGNILFRPPNGKKLIFLPYYLSKQERKTILWNIEPESYPEIANDSENISDYVVENIEPGSIILLHVMYENRRASLNSLKEIVSSLKQQGYAFVTVNELLKHQQK